MPINPSIANLRREYTLAGLRRADMSVDAIAQFSKWFDQALAAQVAEPNAMTLATANAANQPSARIVLLKNVEPRGFSFFTNYGSRKGHELEKNPQAALVFFWPELERQVCIAGKVEKVSRAESEKYFNSRPRGSRLSAWVSNQSEAIANREALEDKMKALEAKYPGEEVPLPSYWGGFCLTPARMEFWQGRPSRLHDRFQYSRSSSGNEWLLERLSP
jgi:pyridoxamine 5'-phosphate oxidase